MAVLDRKSPLPLWAQLAGELTKRVAAGDFSQGFPGEFNLMKEYAVSRQTVRAALGELERRGMLLRERGRGTALVSPPLEQPLNALYTLNQLTDSAGLVERSEVMRLDRISAPDVAAILGRKAEDQFLYLERLRIVGEEPVAIYRSWLVLPEAEQLITSDLASGSLYSKLAEFCNVRITSGWERIRAAIATAEEQELLHIPSGAAVFVIERLASSDNLGIEWRRGVVRSDRYAFRADWPGAVRSVHITERNEV